MVIDKVKWHRSTNGADPLVGILVELIRMVPSIGRLWLGLLGCLIPFTPLDFVSQCQCWPKKCFRRCSSFQSICSSPLHWKFTLPLLYSSLVSWLFPQLMDNVLQFYFSSRVCVIIYIGIYKEGYVKWENLKKNKMLLQMGNWTGVWFSLLIFDFFLIIKMSFIFF